MVLPSAMRVPVMLLGHPQPAPDQVELALLQSSSGLVNSLRWMG